MAIFCPSCGHQQENENGQFCSKCGAPLNNAQQNTAQQNFNQQTVNPAMQMAPQESHTLAIVGGYISATLLTFLFGIFGTIIAIIFGVYLYTRDNEEVHKHGIIIIVVSIVMVVLTIVILGAILSSMYYY